MACCDRPKHYGKADSIRGSGETEGCDRLENSVFFKDLSVHWVKAGKKSDFLCRRALRGVKREEEFGSERQSLSAGW